MMIDHSEFDLSNDIAPGHGAPIDYAAHVADGRRLRSQAAHAVLSHLGDAALRVARRLSLPGRPRRNAFSAMRRCG